jgi:hypothetical protein
MSISTNGCDARYDRERFTGGVIGKLLAGTKTEAYHAFSVLGFEFWVPHQFYASGNLACPRDRKTGAGRKTQNSKRMVLEKVWLRAKRKGQL